MIPSLLYWIAYHLTMNLPLKVSYAIAGMLADMFFYISGRDRRVVINNMRIVCGNLSDKELAGMSREVFRNFARYLVDFFRFEKIDSQYIKSMVRVVGRENVERALENGKGVIMLSAHIGNWELGGAVLASLGYDINVVALPHSHKGINDFFRRQRGIVNMKAIEIGSALKGCYKVLKSNGLLALLGDRDFTKNGVPADFFGRKVLLPVGAAALCHRIDAPVVPCFMVREKDYTFTISMDSPIYSDQSISEDKDVERLMKIFSGIIEYYVRRYPMQWYVFKDIWNINAKDMRPDTIV